MIHALFDRLSNIVSGLGTGADKSVFNTYRRSVYVPEEVYAAYENSWYGNIIDILAEDSFREWRSVQADNDQIEAIEAEETRLKTRQKFVQAYKWALSQGGAALFMGGLPGSLDMPVNPNAISKGALKWLTPMTRTQITPMDRVIDPGREDFNDPSYYMIGTTRVHPSRVIRLIGVDRPDDMAWDGWGDPLWFRLRDSVTNLDATSSGMAALVQEAKIDVFGVPHLAEKVATTEDQRRMTERFLVAAQLKSLTNALIMDAGDSEGKGGETYEQKQPSFAGLPDVWDRHALVMSGMSGIPQTRLYGRSPQGMNSTGEADEANHAKGIRQRQELRIAPALSGYDEIIIRSSLGSRPPEIYFEWRPLYSISEKDGAEIEAKYAEGFAKRLSTGAIQDDVLAKAELNRMIESGRYAGIEDAISDSENDGIVDPDEREQVELTRMQAEAEIAAAGAPVVE